MNRRVATTPLLITLLIALLSVGGCKGGASVTVDVRVPRPLVEPINATMGVYFDEALRNYVHEEELADHGNYRIDIGASQAPVFAQVFDAMFKTVVPMDKATAEDESNPTVTFATVTESAADVDGVLAPNIDEVQFAIPAQTGGEFYEVWIRYRMRLYDTNGAVLAEWPLIGYGKANQRNYGTIDQKESGLNAATIWALRDAAALLSFQFRDQAEVQDWLVDLAGATP